MLCQAFPLLAVIALHQLFLSNLCWSALLLLAISIGAQFWAGFYNGFFMMTLIAILFVTAMLISDCRRKILSTAFQNRIAIIVSGVFLAALLILPAIHYLRVLNEVGGHNYQTEVATTLIPPQAWLYPGPFSVIYRSLCRLSMFAQLPIPLEQSLGMGLLTTGVAIGGLWRNRQRMAIILLAIVGIVIIGLITEIDGHSLWWFVYRFIPGGTAIRVPGRLGLLLAFPIAAGVALFFDICRLDDDCCFRLSCSHVSPNRLSHRLHTIARLFAIASIKSPRLSRQGL